MIKEKNKLKLPIFKILLGHFDLLLKADMKAWILCFAFAGLATILYSLSGNMIMCISSNYRETHFCGNSLPIFVLTTVLMFIIECVFARNWVEIALEKNKTDWKNIIIPNKKDLKIMGLTFAYILTLLVAVLSFYLLYKRIPNPNWKIELVYFGVISTGFLLPLLALRFGSLEGAVALGEPLPSIKEMWKRTSGYSIAIFFALILTMMLGLFFTLQISRLVLNAGIESSYIQSLFVEFINNLVKFIMVAIIANFCYLQYIMFFKGEDDNEKK